MVEHELGVRMERGELTDDCRPPAREHAHRQSLPGRGRDNGRDAGMVGAEALGEPWHEPDGHCAGGGGPHADLRRSSVLEGVDRF